MTDKQIPQRQRLKNSSGTTSTTWRRNDPGVVPTSQKRCRSMIHSKYLRTNEVFQQRHPDKVPFGAGDVWSRLTCSLEGQSMLHVHIHGASQHCSTNAQHQASLGRFCSQHTTATLGRPMASAFETTIRTCTNGPAPNTDSEAASVPILKSDIPVCRNTLKILS